MGSSNINKRKRKAAGATTTTKTGTSLSSSNTDGGAGKHRGSSSSASSSSLWNTLQSKWKLLLKNNKQLVYSCIILIIAIIVSVLYNEVNDTDNNNKKNDGSGSGGGGYVDPRLQHLVQMGCTTTTSSSSSSESGGHAAATNKAYCSDSVIPTRRTFQTTTSTKTSTTKSAYDDDDKTLFIIPRSMQIWDIDAIRYIHKHDKYKELLSSRHEYTNNPLATGAYLAAYLSLLLIEASNENDNNNNILSSNSIIQHAYLNALPTIEELKDSHPIFWYGTNDNKQKQKQQQLPMHTLSYNLVGAYRDMIISEYKALTKRSSSSSNSLFATQVNSTLYMATRINVMTRSFNPTFCYNKILLQQFSDERNDEVEKDVHDEIEMYRQLIGRDDYLVQVKEQDDGTSDNSSVVVAAASSSGGGGGCHAMVPFLDSLNHHTTPNVNYKYSTSKGGFVIESIISPPPKIIPSNNQELFDSYGKHTDSHLFAKYGFTIGDGSTITQISLALYHPIYDLLNPSNRKQQQHQAFSNEYDKDGNIGGFGEFSYLPFGISTTTCTKNNDEIKHNKNIMMMVQQQRKGLLQYLRYDDGYTSCIKPSDDSLEYYLKNLKLHHLELIANQPSRWLLHIDSSRNPTTKPPKSSNTFGGGSVNPPEFQDPKSIKVDLSKVIATCRLLSLTIHDYNGNAIQILQDNMENRNFMLDVHDSGQFYDSNKQEGTYYSKESLDYRSFTCLARLAGIGLMKYNINIKDQYKIVKELNKQQQQRDANNATSSVFDTTNQNKWTLGHVQLGEMQTFQAIMGIAFTNLQQIEDQFNLKKNGGQNPPEFTVRDKSCPQEYVDTLITT